MFQSRRELVTTSQQLSKRRLPIIQPPSTISRCACAATLSRPSCEKCSGVLNFTPLFLAASRAASVLMLISSLLRSAMAIKSVRVNLSRLGIARKPADPGGSSGGESKYYRDTLIFCLTLLTRNANALSGSPSFHHGLEVTLNNFLYLAHLIRWAKFEELCPLWLACWSRHPSADTSILERPDYG